MEYIGDFENFFVCVDFMFFGDGYLFIVVLDFVLGCIVGDILVLWEEYVNYFIEEMLLVLFVCKGFEVVVVKKYNFSGGLFVVIVCCSK